MSIKGAKLLAMSGVFGALEAMADGIVHDAIHKPTSGRSLHHHNSFTKKQWQKRKARLRMQKQSRKANR